MWHSTLTCCDGILCLLLVGGHAGICGIHAGVDLQPEGKAGWGEGSNHSTEIPCTWQQDQCFAAGRHGRSQLTWLVKTDEPLT